MEPSQSLNAKKIHKRKKKKEKKILSFSEHISNIVDTEP